VPLLDEPLAQHGARGIVGIRQSQLELVHDVRTEPVAGEGCVAHAKRDLGRGRGGRGGGGGGG
jgi:hypothetical protein